jgi:hypothetical protein
MNSTANAVLQLVEKLWHGVFWDRRVFLDVTKRGGIDHVADSIAFDSLVFGDCSTTV